MRQAAKNRKKKIMDQQTQNFVVPTPPSPNPLPQSDAKPVKEKLTNIESFLLIIFVLFVLFLYSFGPEQGLRNQLQKYLMWIWLIVGVGLFYRKYSFFGGSLPQEENTKLTMLEKVLIWIFGIISPSIVGLVSLGVWYKKNPYKARRATIITLILFILEICIGFLIGFLKSQS